MNKEQEIFCLRIIKYLAQLRTKIIKLIAILYQFENFSNWVFVMNLDRIICPIMAILLYIIMLASIVAFLVSNLL